VITPRSTSATCCCLISFDCFYQQWFWQWLWRRVLSELSVTFLDCLQSGVKLQLMLVLVRLLFLLSKRLLPISMLAAKSEGITKKAMSLRLSRPRTWKFIAKTRHRCCLYRPRTGDNLSQCGQYVAIRFGALHHKLLQKFCANGERSKRPFPWQTRVSAFIRQKAWGGLRRGNLVWIWKKNHWKLLIYWVNSNYRRQVRW